MHRSESQEALIREMMTLDITNPIKYEAFDYDKSEWDNIPVILPRFVIFLSKHLGALIRHLGIEAQAETTAQLRTDVFQNLGQIRDEIATNKRGREQGDAALQEKIDDLSGEVQSLRSRFDSMRAEFANSAYDQMREFVRVERDDMQEESHLYVEEGQFSEAKYRSPRMFTLNQIRDLIYLHLNRSKLRETSKVHTIDLNEHSKNIDDLQEFSKKITADLGQEFEAVF